jgi:hypothetical protein
VDMDTAATRETAMAAFANKMLLMDLVRDNTVKVPVIERQICMCSACKHLHGDWCSAVAPGTQ